ncbi:MAG TPA: F0F1 ATP synthase subunit delta [Candidatus Paceibacterota bacterium]|nr:F0F1 ATP synthase subunit delta [Candidatus Paceibacterota bacterium]
MQAAAKKIGVILAQKLSHSHAKEEVIKAAAKLIFESNKTSKLPEIIAALNTEWNKLHNEIDVTITAVDKENVHFPKEFAGKKVNLSVKEDRSLLGGIKISAEDYTIDNTLLSKVRKLRA